MQTYDELLAKVEKSLERTYYIEFVTDKDGQDVGQSVGPDFVVGVSYDIFR